MRMSGEYILGSNIGLEFGLDTTVFSVSGKSFNRNQFETALKYRLEFGNKSSPFVIQPKFGFGMRQYIEFAPDGGGSVTAVRSPYALGLRAGLDIRKKITSKLSLGIKFSYFYPLVLLGLDAHEITGDASFRNYTLGLQAVYWLGGRWGDGCRPVYREAVD